jgi:hypothetical protein
VNKRARWIDHLFRIPKQFTDLKSTKYSSRNIKNLTQQTLVEASKADWSVKNLRDYKKDATPPGSDHQSPDG